MAAKDSVTLVMDEDIREEEFSQIMSRLFAEYMAATITDRAIPDARDGLKPVQRRILYCMYINGYRSSRTTIKSAKIVGQVTGEYHPHGDVAIYDTMVRLAQPFTLRYPLVEGQGNFGSLDADPPAASRYTEARLSPIAEVLLSDVDQETVPLMPTYLQDPKIMEPFYLTGHLPPVVNPISGVATGFSTSVAPHNLNEVLNAAIALFDHPHMTVKELLAYIQGPDYPTGGQVVGTEGVIEYLETGKGRFTMRGKVRLENTPKGQSLVITEIPYTTKDKIKASIGKALNERKIEGIVDLRDESDDDHGMRIVLTLRKDAVPSQVLNAIYQYTDLQQNVTVQMVFLMGQPGQRAFEPKQVGMLELLNYWNKHQLDVLTKRLSYELRRGQERLHIVQGLIVGAANAQAIVRIFQQAADRTTAKAEIRQKYKLSEIQAETIAGMTLSQVTKLDAGRYETERAQLEARIAELTALLADHGRLVALLKSEYRAVKDKFGDARRTIIDTGAAPEILVVQNIIEHKAISIQISPDSHVRMAAEGKRKGKDYPTIAQFSASSTDYVMFVANSGKVYAVRANKLPETGGKGESLRKIINLGQHEQIVGAFAFDTHSQDRYLLQFTEQGKVKKSSLYEYRSADSSGLADLNLIGDDKVKVAMLVDEPEQYIVVSSDARALRFAADTVRATGRVGQGVQAIALSSGATVLAAFYVSEKDNRYLLAVSAGGFSKKTALSEYPAKGRATGGVQVTGIAAKDRLAAVAVVGTKDEVMLWTAKDLVIRLAAKAIPTQPRDRKGVPVPGLPKGEEPAGMV
ncbi:MAG: DNA gyrase subunit A [Dehalococcoidia bacterium]|nr:DNA gyrase subunit A [Dehalococcoidia bacterium]